MVNGIDWPVQTLPYVIAATLEYVGIIITAILSSEEDTMPRFVFIGSYTWDNEQAALHHHRREGIYTCQVSADGQLSLLSATPSGLNPTFIALHPGRPLFYAVNEKEADQVRTFALDPATGALTQLNSQPTGGVWPCHLSLDPAGKWLLTANYYSGSLTIFPILPDGRLGPYSDIVKHRGIPGPDPVRQKTAHPHMIKFDPTGHFVLVSDLGLDRIFIYILDASSGKLQPYTPGEVIMPPASGPRHFVFNSTGRFLYLANELDSTVTACTWDGGTGRLTPFQKLPTLPAGFEGVNNVADIHLHPNGRFLYVSNRGHDSLAIFAVDERSGLLSALGHAPSGGRTPRGFAIDPFGKFLLVANQDSNSIITLPIEEQTGLLSAPGVMIDLPLPACVLFYQ